MKKEFNYESELKNICEELNKNFKNKYTFINEVRILHCINKVIKLNRRTKNEHIDELMYMIGRSKLQYKKYCHRNNYYTNPDVNEKINEKYIKLSKKAMKIKTKKSTVKKSGKDLKIEYNSERGSYKIRTLNKDGTERIRYYRIKNLKNIDRKRKLVLEDLKHSNFGINVFDELGVKENMSYKLNPDIIHILIKEGKIDYAKMYIKSVLGEGSIVYKPFEVKYELNRDLSKGVFSREENKNMKRMAKYDRVATKLVIFDDRKRKEIVESVLCRNDGTNQIVTGIRRMNNISNKKVARRIDRSQYEKEVV